MKEAKFGKDFNNTLGDFQDLKAKYFFEKTNSGQDLFIFDLKEDQKDFVIVFSCRQFLEHAIIQESSGQSSFICMDTTFNLVRGEYKLIVIGKNF